MRNAAGITIADYIPKGHINARKAPELRKATGLDARTIRALIHRERLNGTPIVNDMQTGYFIATNADECKRFARSMRSRAREIMKVADIIAEIDPESAV